MIHEFTFNVQLYDSIGGVGLYILYNVQYTK